MERVGTELGKSEMSHQSRVKYFEYFDGQLIELSEQVKNELNAAYEFWNNPEPDVDYDPELDCPYDFVDQYDYEDGI